MTQVHGPGVSISLPAAANTGLLNNIDLKEPGVGASGSSENEWRSSPTVMPQCAEFSPHTCESLSGIGTRCGRGCGCWHIPDSLNFGHAGSPTLNFIGGVQADCRRILDTFSLRKLLRC